MGTSRRYAHRVDERMNQRIIERIARENPLQSLTDAELELGSVPLTKDPAPRAVRAWVRFGNEHVRVDAVAVAWTPNAIAIRFELGDVEHRAWVWSGAVTNRAAAR